MTWGGLNSFRKGWDVESWRITFKGEEGGISLLEVINGILEGSLISRFSSQTVQGPQLI